MTERSIVRVRIEGKVQGVWYRGWTIDEAKKRGLDGWVRNLRDGSVEAVFSGPTEEITTMLIACHEGPLGADVERVYSEPMTEEPPAGFVQLPTA